MICLIIYPLETEDKTTDKIIVKPFYQYRIK